MDEAIELLFVAPVAAALGWLAIYVGRKRFERQVVELHWNTLRSIRVMQVALPVFSGGMVAVHALYGPAAAGCWFVAFFVAGLVFAGVESVCLWKSIAKDEEEIGSAAASEARTRLAVQWVVGAALLGAFAFKLVTLR